MHITHLSLTNFRNYGRLELDLVQGATLLHGNNAQGKTNLLEAVYYLATTRSPDSDQDAQLLNWEAAEQEEPVVVARLVAHLATQRGKHLVEVRLIQEQGNGRSAKSIRREALVDRRKVRLMDLLGNLRVVLFLPQDVQLLTGSPSVRRRYMDITLCQIDPIYCQALSDYNKVLEQRNALLKQLAENGGSRDVLPIFTEKLVHLGGRLLVRRAQFLAMIGREAQRIYYEDLTSGGETIRLNYLPRLQTIHSLRSETADETLLKAGQWLQENGEDENAVIVRLGQAFAESLPIDLQRGSTTVGPHRDDWFFWMNGRHVSHYGSRGQQRSTILALKLAEINWMTHQTGETPLLLLDEVVAELDEQRRALLLHTVQKANQAILTATDPGMFTADFLRHATTLTVRNGRIQQDNKP